MAETFVVALDHDFPTSILTRLPWPANLKIVALRDMHADLVKGHDDWEVLRELRLRGGVDVFVTLDSKMLQLPKEMVVLHQSRLSLVVLEDVNDPLLATGLLMVHLPSIAKMLKRRVPQLWVIKRPATHAPIKPWSNRIFRLAAIERLSPGDLYERERLRPNPFLRE